MDICDCFYVIRSVITFHGYVFPKQCTVSGFFTIFDRHLF